LAHYAKALERNAKFEDARDAYGKLAARDASFEVDLVRLSLRSNWRSLIKPRKLEDGKKAWKELRTNLDGRLQLAERSGLRQTDIVRQRVELLLTEARFLMLLRARLPIDEKKSADDLMAAARQSCEQAHQLVELSRDLFDNQLDYWLILINVMERQG